MVLGIPLGILCSINVNGILSGIEEIINILARFWYTLKDVLAVLAGTVSSGRELSAGRYVPVRLLDPAFYLEEIPVVLPWGGILAIAAGTLALSVVVSALPSIRAGREKPLDTLRKF